MSHYQRTRPARTQIASFRHIEAGAAYTIADVTVSALVERNPYYPGEYGEEEPYSVQDLRVVDAGGREVSYEEWEETEYYTLLIEAYQEKEEGDRATMIDGQIARIREQRALLIEAFQDKAARIDEQIAMAMEARYA